MSFLLASSPRRPDADAQEPAEEDAQPMLRSGGVRATSHLPAAAAVQPLGRSYQQSKPDRMSELWQQRMKDLLDEQRKRRTPQMDTSHFLPPGTGTGRPMPGRPSTPGWRPGQKRPDAKPFWTPPWDRPGTSPEDTTPWHLPTPGGGGKPWHLPDDGSGEGLPWHLPTPDGGGKPWHLPDDGSGEGLPWHLPTPGGGGKPWHLPDDGSGEGLPWHLPTPGGGGKPRRVPGMTGGVLMPPGDASGESPAPWHPPGVTPRVPDKPQFGPGALNPDELPGQWPRIKPGRNQFPGQNPWMDHGGGGSSKPSMIRPLQSGPR